ncbi:MAG TPA: PmoA family protein [Candidatus Hydrogenedentes bacterium]|nr:PmoA family protein [Candidatus Hydrogenedentota bacterium]HOK89300.1 PmoA family protein [Candidatus Hydrogenedentota bacterium]HOV60261.1 PmoA family protein [Candidatus Hydrogenedentota bacterium]HPO30186.1 PmoA family protein [Candidatus Hydrogenedentota bacterium]
MGTRRIVPGQVMMVLVSWGIVGVSLMGATFAEGGPVVLPDRPEGVSHPRELRLTAPGGMSLCYRFGPPSPKSYIRELVTPGGVNVARDDVEDHVHHHGLMYALGVDGRTFWEEWNKKTGWQGLQHADSLCVTGQGIEETLRWVWPDGTVYAVEHRRLTLLGGQRPARLTWETTLEPPENRPEITLEGNHYYGMGLRFPRTMDGRTRFVHDPNGSAETFRGDERLIRGAAWCAAVSSPDGHPVTVAFFDRAANTRPAVWFTMNEPFAYLSATLALHETPLTVTREQPLRVTYGVALWDEEAAPETIAAEWEKWSRDPVRAERSTGK